MIFKYINDELNKYIVPMSFHDMGLVNFELNSTQVKIIFMHNNWNNELTHWNSKVITFKYPDVALFEVIYNDCEFIKSSLTNDLNIITMDVLDLYEEDGIVTLDLVSDDEDNQYHSISFKPTSYNWKFNGIINEDEYDQYIDDIENINSKENLPHWTQFNM